MLGMFFKKCFQIRSKVKNKVQHLKKKSSKISKQIKTQIQFYIASKRPQYVGYFLSDPINIKTE